MRMLLLIILLFFGVQVTSFGQTTDCNLIIELDEEILRSSAQNYSLIIEDSSGVKREIKVDYYPGNLKLATKDYDEIMNPVHKKIYLSFEQSGFVNGKRSEFKKYQIEMNKNWFASYFFILRIYNTDCKKYRKLAIPGKSYAFEYEGPDGSSIIKPK